MPNVRDMHLDNHSLCSTAPRKGVDADATADMSVMRGTRELQTESISMDHAPGNGEEAVAPVKMRAEQHKIRLIFNPHAGRKAGLATNRTTLLTIRDLMARYGLGNELVVADSEAAAVTAAREAVRLGYDMVVAAGGDGTVAAIASELLNSETALGILPLGSVMNVARMLGIPRELDGAAEILATGKIRAIDVGEANGQLFLEGGSVGLNATIFREFQRLEAGEYRSLFTALWVLLRYRPARMTISLDDQTISTRALMAAVANGPYTGLSFTVAPKAKVDDGLFDVRVFHRFSRWELVRHFGAIALGRRHYSPKIATYRSAKVRIESVHPLPSRVDSHDLGTTPVSFVVRHAALKIVSPDWES